MTQVYAQATADAHNIALYVPQSRVVDTLLPKGGMVKALKRAIKWWK